MLTDLQQYSSEPAATCLSIWHEERHRRQVEHHVPAVPKYFTGPGEGQAAVWTGLSGECDTALQVSKDSTPNGRILIHYSQKKPQSQSHDLLTPYPTKYQCCSDDVLFWGSTLE